MFIGFFYRLPDGTTLRLYLEEVRKARTRTHGQVTGVVGVLEVERPDILLRRRTPAFFIPCDDPTAAIARKTLFSTLLTIAEHGRYGVVMQQFVGELNWRELKRGLNKSLGVYAVSTLPKEVRYLGTAPAAFSPFPHHAVFLFFEHTYTSITRFYNKRAPHSFFLRI